MRIVTLLISLVFGITAHAGGWPKKKGEGYYKLSYSWINGKHFFDSSGEKVRLGRPLGFYTASFYGEYGVTDRLTAITYLPFSTKAELKRDGVDRGGSINTIGDAIFGVRFGLIVDRPTVLSASLSLGAPFGHTSTDTTSSVASLQTGDGEFNQLIKLESGHSLKNGFYASTFAGVNIRSKGFSEELRVGGEIGHVGELVIAILKIQSVSSFGNGDETEAANSDLFNNNQEFVSVSPEVAVKVSETAGITFNYRAFLSGKKTLASPSYTLGIYLDI